MIYGKERLRRESSKLRPKERGIGGRAGRGRERRTRMEIKNSKKGEYDAVTVMKDNRGEKEKLKIWMAGHSKISVFV